MSIITNPSLNRPNGTGFRNWTGPFAQGLCFLWQASDPVPIPRDSVRNQTASFALGSASGISVVTDPTTGRVISTDGSNDMAWTDADIYHKPTTQMSNIMRLKLTNLLGSSAGQGASNVALTWDLPGGAGIAGFYNYTRLTINGDQYSNYAPATFGTWYTFVGRYDAGLQSLRSSVFNDDGFLVSDSNVFAPADTITYAASPGGPNITQIVGLWDYWGMWNIAFSDAEITQLVQRRQGVASTPMRSIYLYAGNLAVNKSLTGVSATSAVGNLTPTTNTSVTKALTGVSATGAVGSVSAQLGSALNLTGVSATSHVGTLNVSIAARLLTTYPNTTSIGVPITIDNLPSGGGRQSAALFNIPRLYEDVLLRMEAVGTAFSSGAIDVFAYGAAEASNYVYTDNCTGQDGVFAAPPLNAVYVGTVKVIGTNTSIGSPMSLAAAFGGEIPDSWGVIVINRTGAALGTGNVLAYQGRWLTYSATSFAIMNSTVNLSGLAPTGNIGNQSVSLASYTPPTKQGYTLSRDYTAGSTIATNADIPNNFYYYPYPVSTLGAPVPAAIAGLGYNLVFDDDFNSIDIGTTGAHKWYYYPWSQALPPSANVSVANSILNIKWTQGQSTNDTSIATVAYDRSQGQGWYLGYFEYYMKWDVQSGAMPTVGGISLAHVLGTDVTSGSEHFATIDAFQGAGDTPTLLQGISTYSVGTYPSYTVTTYNASTSVTSIASTDFHKYGFLWTAGNVAVYYDDAFKFNMATNANTDTTKDAQAVVMSAAWDAVHGPGTSTLNVFVDWVRVWQINVASPILLQGNDWEQFTNSTSNLSVSGTNILLTATLPSGTTGFNVSRQICTPSNQPLSSGLIQTIFTQFYGYWEANVLVQKARGGNPRFYLSPVTGAIRPEIVIAEWPNNGTLTTTSSIHPAYPADSETITYSHTATGYTTSTDVYSPGFDYSLGFHVVGMDWAPGLLTTYVDGVLITSKTFNWVTNTGSDPGPAAAVLVMAIGTSYGGDPQSPSNFPQVLKVNYLRIWQKNPPPPTTIVTPTQGNANLFGTQDLTQFTGFSGGNTTTPPAAASAAGYNTLTFSDDFTSLSTIDVTGSQAAGFNWYPKNFFGVNTPGGDYSISNSVLTISTDASGYGLGLASATDIGGNAYNGHAFGNGFYAEASMAFDPTLAQSSFSSWPAFWSMAIQHCALGVNTNFSEIDFFEAYPQVSGSIIPLFADHHWVSVGNGFFNVNSDEPTLPGGTDFNQFHTYGCLWIPMANGGTGIVRRYFDNLLLSTTILTYTATGTSSDANGVSGSPGAVPAGVYSIFDSQQHAIMLGTGPNWPVRFDWVRIWTV